jgi:hypothetical protein
MSSPVTAKLVKSAKIAAKVFKKDLPNRVHRGLIESTRKPNGYGLAPNGFDDFEADAHFTRKEFERIAAYIAYWKEQPCECKYYPSPFDCSCCDYQWTCSRCETLDDLKFSDWVDFESDTPTHISDLCSTKGSKRDGTTWRRKPTNFRPTRVAVKKMKSEHRDHLTFF